MTGEKCHDKSIFILFIFEYKHLKKYKYIFSDVFLAGQILPGRKLVIKNYVECVPAVEI